MAEKEQRYVVLKLKDIEEYLGTEDKKRLSRLCYKVSSGRLRANKPLMDTVVVEHDWPIYDDVWKMVLSTNRK